MTFEEIKQLSVDQLNLEIDKACFYHDWKEVLVPTDLGDITVYELYHSEEGNYLRSSVPHLHYTDSWNRLMPLALKYGVEHTHFQYGEGDCIVDVYDCDKKHVLDCPSDDVQGIRENYARMILFDVLERASEDATAGVESVNPHDPTSQL